ncbi:MAG TPA: FAD-containing oxidoreductase [Alphaproteobacteria bacterium]|jgi:pyruvate/2-oxoglutarate dehydrogenase complex dihydrolipoamide dehydrogenase (E3) component|nr:FAD-containing oxidoreductase [Alphaproteobacteria bacterium]
MSRAFDAIVIGAGQAGPPLAERLGQAGMTVALIERKDFGGTCVNTGCTPTKTLVASAYAAFMARRAGDFGVTIGGPVGVDMKAVKARKDKVAGGSRANVESWVAGMKGVTAFRGHAQFESPTEVRVGGELLSAPKIFLNVGCRPIVPDMPGVHQVKHLTSTAILELDTLPRHLVVIGGSYIGLEFAQMYRRFGAEVTVVEKADRLVQREDPDISAAVQDILEAEGIHVRLKAECISFRPQGDEIGVGVDCTDGPPEIVGSHVLLAVGRRPNTDDLGLDKTGIAMDQHGYIPVDDQCRSSVPGIWAIGDCNGKGAFTHTSWNDFEIVAANLLDDDPRRVSDRIPVYGLFIDPPLGRIGMTEAEARKSGRKVLIGTRQMTRVKRSVEKGESLGFMKALVDADTKEILGAAILGLTGDEVVHGMLDVMYAKAPYTTISRAIHIHPTVSELIPTLLQSLKPLD